LTLLVDLQRDTPGDSEVAALLGRTRDELRTATRQALDAATTNENASNWPAALQQYERARQFDPSVGGVDQSIVRVRARMKSDGTDAFVRAKQYDAVDRVADAITWYERAYRNLLEDDPNRKAAADRLVVLRAR